MTCLMVCIKVSVGKTLIALNRSTKIFCSSPTYAITYCIQKPCFEIHEQFSLFTVKSHIERKV